MAAKAAKDCVVQLWLRARSCGQIMLSRCGYCPAGYPIHVLQGGNERQLGFAHASDLAVAASRLKVYADQYNVQVLGWVFMLNHVRLLLTPQTDSGMRQLM
jgi:REP element-mobilizing transposase RayT